MTIVFVTAFGILSGIVGMLVAEPVAAITIAATRALYVEPMEASSAADVST